jgi:hypothetical protein
MGLGTDTGFTVMVKVDGVPGHDTPLSVKNGVTVTTLEIGAPVVFVAVKLRLDPLPDWLSPTWELLLLQS